MLRSELQTGDIEQVEDGACEASLSKFPWPDSTARRYDHSSLPRLDRATLTRSKPRREFR